MILDLIKQIYCLTHKVPVLFSYRNQSIDLLCKSIDWFLYEGNTDTEWVNVLTSHNGSLN